MELRHAESPMGAAVQKDFRADSACVSATSPSPNVSERACAADILLLHYTGMTDGPSALRWLCNPESKVSCHYFVDEAGKVTQLVPETVRAHHAGVSSWEGTTDINSRSIGIEIVNPGHEFGYRDFPQAQIASVIELSWDIVSRHGIKPQRVLAHSDVAPARKQDPGEKFPWEELYEAGIGHWIAPVAIGDGALLQPGDSGPAVNAMQAALKDYGYGQQVSGIYDDATMLVVTAFQRHFRPARVDGIADHSTLRTLERLLASRPL
jgi:N-acetylmuramoyl-L-alanine amidase